MTSFSCSNPLFGGWQLTIPAWQYLLYCAIWALVFRLLHSLWRAFAATRGDFPHDLDRKETVIPSYPKAFWYCFNGFNEFKEHSDLWIPFCIGVIELAAYPRAAGTRSTGCHRCLDRCKDGGRLDGLASFADIVQSVPLVQLAYLTNLVRLAFPICPPGSMSSRSLLNA